MDNFDQEWLDENYDLGHIPDERDYCLDNEGTSQHPLASSHSKLAHSFASQHPLPSHSFATSIDSVPLEMEELQTTDLDVFESLQSEQSSSQCPKTPILFQHLHSQDSGYIERTADADMSFFNTPYGNYPENINFVTDTPDSLYLKDDGNSEGKVSEFNDSGNSSMSLSGFGNSDRRGDSINHEYNGQPNRSNEPQDGMCLEEWLLDSYFDEYQRDDHLALNFVSTNFFDERAPDELGFPNNQEIRSGGNAVSAGNLDKLVTRQLCGDQPSCQSDLVKAPHFSSERSCPASWNRNCDESNVLPFANGLNQPPRSKSVDANRFSPNNMVGMCRKMGGFYSGGLKLPEREKYGNPSGDTAFGRQKEKRRFDAIREGNRTNSNNDGFLGRSGLAPQTFPPRRGRHCSQPDTGRPSRKKRPALDFLDGATAGNPFFTDTVLYVDICPELLSLPSRSAIESSTQTLGTARRSVIAPSTPANIRFSSLDARQLTTPKVNNVMEAGNVNVVTRDVPDTPAATLFEQEKNLTWQLLQELPSTITHLTPGPFTASRESNSASESSWISRPEMNENEGDFLTNQSCHPVSNVHQESQVPMCLLPNKASIMPSSLPEKNCLPTDMPNSIHHFHNATGHEFALEKCRGNSAIASLPQQEPNITQPEPPTPNSLASNAFFHPACISNDVNVQLPFNTKIDSNTPATCCKLMTQQDGLVGCTTSHGPKYGLFSPSQPHDLNRTPDNPFTASNPEVDPLRCISSSGNNTIARHPEPYPFNSTVSGDKKPLPSDLLLTRLQGNTELALEMYDRMGLPQGKQVACRQTSSPAFLQDKITNDDSNLQHPVVVQPKAAVMKAKDASRESTMAPGLAEAFEKSVEEKNIRRILQQELKFKILLRRHAEGRGDIPEDVQKPKPEPTEEELKKRQHQLQLNRVAAQKFRQKKKRAKEDLSKDVMDEDKKNKELKKKVAEMENTKRLLIQALAVANVPASILTNLLNH